MPATDPLYTVRDGHLCFDGVDLVELADDARDAVLRVQRAPPAGQRRGRAWGRSAACIRPTEVFYASKACSNLWFLGVVRDAGANVEVNAGGELDKALAAGFEPRQIVFNGVAKTKAEIERAVACGVRAFMVDSLHELGRIGEVAAGLGTVAAVAPRIDVHVPTLTHPGLETAHGGKAGIDRDDAAAAFRLAAEHPNLEPGRHAPAHRLADHQRGAVPAGDRGGARPRRRGGGGRRRAAAVPQRRRRLRRAVPRGAGDVPPERLLLLAADAPPTTPRWSAASSRRGGRTSTLFLEPGRSIAATTAVLVARVENEKTKGRRDAAGRRIGDERWVTVDAGFNTLLEHTNYAWYYRTIVASRAGEEADADFRLAGPLCDGGDVFAGDADSPYRRFPAATTVGDVVAFLDAGAYTLEMMNPYNARPTAAAFAVTAAGELVQIRRRDTAEDLVAHDLVPGAR